MEYTVERNGEAFGKLTAEEALAKVMELIPQAAGDVYIYDSFGDPMGLADLERAAADNGAR